MTRSPRRGPRRSYAQETSWRRYQGYFEPELQVQEGHAPAEHWWRWHEADVHVDRYEVPSPRARLIILHGAGGYSRMMAPIGVAAQREGYAAVAPDLPGYGLTRAPKTLVDYSCWIELVVDLIEAERAASPVPI